MIYGSRARPIVPASVPNQISRVFASKTRGDSR